MIQLTLRLYLSVSFPFFPSALCLRFWHLMLKDYDRWTDITQTQKYVPVKKSPKNNVIYNR